MISIAIADDHALFAEGLRNALQTQPDFLVKIMVASGQALLDELENEPVDVALVDYEMPGGGADLIRALPTTSRKVVVTMYPEAWSELLDAGADLVLSKSTPLLTLGAAIRAVHAGVDVPQGPERDSILESFIQPQLDPGARSLTERETQLLQVLASGVSSTEELAEALFISQKTVKNHLASIFSKLAVSDRTQAAIEAIRLGIANPR